MISHRLRETSDTGVKLALELNKLPAINDPVIVSLANSGIPLGCELSKLLGWPLDILSVNQLSMPGNQDEHLGAVTSQGDYHVTIDTAIFGTNYRSLIERLCRFEKKRLALREQHYRNTHPIEPIASRDVILTDIFASTGASIAAAIKTIEKQRPRSITIATPFTTPPASVMIRKYADNLVFLETTKSKVKNEGLHHNIELDESILKYLLWRTWSKSHIFSSASNSNNTDSCSFIRATQVESNQWGEFMQQFSSDYKGWSMVGKTLASGRNNHTQMSKPYSHGVRVNDAMFIDIHYVPQAGTVCFRYSTDETRITSTIAGLKNLYYRKSSPDCRVMLLETAKGEIVYLGFREAQSGNLIAI